MNTQRETDEAQLRWHIEGIAGAIGAKDAETLQRIYAPDVVSFDVEAPLQHVGVDAKMKNWERVFTVFREVEYEMRDLALTVGADLAFGHFFGRLRGTLMNGAVTEGIWVRATLCFQKLDGDWRIVHDQASVPIEMLSGRAVTELEP